MIAATELVAPPDTGALTTTIAAPEFVLPGAAAPNIAAGSGPVSGPTAVRVAPLAPGPFAAHRPTSAVDRLLERALEILPFAAASFLISSLVWGSLWLPLPLTIMLLAFDCYWVWRSFNGGFHVLKGYLMLRKEARVDWRARYEEARAQGRAFLRWEDIAHVVIIPTYKESPAKLGATLSRLAESEVAREQILVVLAMEEAEEGCHKKALHLYQEFGQSFLGMFATFHPSDLFGEARGKSSNECWAARHAKRHLVDELGYDLDHLTVTSCDADTLFHPRYFSCLTYEFATHPQRYRRFWQGPIFLHNNIWDVPAPLRLPNTLGSLNHLVRLVRKHRILFPQSTYSLSLRMADEVGYWDVDIIPEDWHMFLKCFFRLGGEVDVEPMLLPVGNDGVRSESYLRTFVAQYEQARRHAWGASDVPYAVRQCLAHPEIPLLRRLRRTWSLLENHLLWSSQWFLITIPFVVLNGLRVGGFGIPLLGDVPLLLDIPGLRDLGLAAVPAWFFLVSSKILMPCMIPLTTMILLDLFWMRPRHPKGFHLWSYLWQLAQWPLLAPITFLFTALPALDAQFRLALGRRLEYKVTEKA